MAGFAILTGVPWLIWWSDYCGPSLEEGSSYLSPDPCSTHSVVIATHSLLLLVSMLGLCCSLCCGPRKASVATGAKDAATKTQSARVLVSGLHWLELFVSVVLILASLLLFLSRIPILSPIDVPLQELLFPAALALPWLAYAVALHSSRHSSKSSFSPIFRVWALLTFVLLGALSFFAVSQYLSSDTIDTHLLIDNVIVVVSLPLALFMFIVVTIVNRTGISVFSDAEHGEPLLAETAPAEAASTSEPPSTYARASSLSIVFFLWISPLLKTGSSRALEVLDVPKMADRDQAHVQYLRFNAMWTKQLTSGRTPSVSRALWGTFCGDLIYTGLLALVKSSVMYAGPLLLDSFVAYVGGERLFPYEGLVLVLALALAKLCETAGDHQYNFRSELLGLNIRSALIGSLFKKGLRLSSKAKQKHTTGEIVNYMSTDAQRLAEIMYELHNIWVLPLQIILALIILSWVVGWAMLAGVFVMFSVMACNFLVAMKQKSFMEGIMEAKDKRMKATTEVLNSMKVIKLYAWQDAYQAKVQELRDVEAGHLSGFMYVAAINIFLLWLSPLAVSVATFGTMVLLGYPLTPGKVFTAIATFRILQEPLRSFPGVISSVTQALVSLDRLTKFLNDEELSDDSVERKPVSESPEVALQCENADVTWEVAEDKECTLKGINVTVPRGSRVAICGAVGSGKSSLLSCFLGEMTRVKGKVMVSGSTAYVSQSAWIQNGTIKDNILFGNPFDEERYKAALSCCSLVKDLKDFAHGDATEIGERGINLSGGQKQRIQLARAVYQDSDIYLLDDPFSAVDAHTGTELFMNCVVTALEKKTVVLVTHQVEFLPAADLVLVMRDGAIVESGRYVDLLEAGLDVKAGGLGALLGAHQDALKSVNSSSNLAGASQVGSQEALTALATPASKDGEVGGGGEEGGKKEGAGGAQLIAEEERESGRVSRAVYWAYITKALGGRHVPFLLLIQLVWQMLQIGSDWWLQYYTSAPEGDKSQMSTGSFMKIYTLLALGSGFFVLVRTVLVAWSGLKTTQAFFQGMLTSIFRAPMSFFDSTPVGRILSRSSTDQAILDLEMPFLYGSFLAILYALLGILVVTSVVTWPVVIAIAGMGVLYLRIQAFYISSSRELSRLNGLTKAPIIQAFSEALAGASTIRAFEHEERFARRSEDRVNTNMKVSFHMGSANEWLGVRLETMGATLLCFSALMLVVLPSNLISPGLAGLSLSYGLALNQCLYWVVWIWCTVENEMVSVERIHQYSNVDSEAPPKLPADENIPPEWPIAGTVEVKELQMRYRPDLPLVLKGISLVIAGGKKVGVVGRTGSGKSTLTQALFRMVEPSGGTILIDGVDICSLGLATLRGRLSIIPQEPTLFHGTLRYNLDPLGIYSDEQLWSALEKCQLDGPVRLTGSGLDAPVQENGENWSIGQRQLVCLGRALLKRSRILVLDEATASVDTQTDAVIQKTIRENFSDCTVISIAHRIPTVIDSDMVLVLDGGVLAEYASPQELLRNPDSLFSKLVAEYSSRSSGISGMARNASNPSLGAQ